MPLTDAACKNAKPDNKPKKLSDGNGMYLEIKPSGAKYWRLAYRFDGKQKLLAFGVCGFSKLQETSGILHHRLL